MMFQIVYMGKKSRFFFESSVLCHSDKYVDYGDVRPGISAGWPDRFAVCREGHKSFDLLMQQWYPECYCVSVSHSEMFSLRDFWKHNQGRAYCDIISLPRLFFPYEVFHYQSARHLENYRVCDKLTLHQL